MWGSGKFPPSQVRLGGSIQMPVASNYDLDNDYDDMMTKALRSYSHHRAREKADSNKAQLKVNLLRLYQRPKTAPPSRFFVSKGHLSGSVLIPRGDAIKEVQKANTRPVTAGNDDADDEDRRPRRVLQLATVNLNMIQQQTKKVACHKKRNEPAHPWFSHSYPSVRSVQRFTRPPQAYMSASVGERELSSALSRSSPSSKGSSKTSSRSTSSSKSPVGRSSNYGVRTPQHAAGARPQSAAVKANKYYYDGGLFTQARNAGNDYFVIHPDWVSESITVQKLSLGDRNKQSSTTSKTGTLPERRCKSAPPSKHRNPITWEAYNS